MSEDWSFDPTRNAFPVATLNEVEAWRSAYVNREICAGLRDARKAGVNCATVPSKLTIEPWQSNPDKETQ